MKWWRKKKRVEKELPSFLKAGLIKCNQRLHRIANFLQHRTNRYSQKKKKMLLLVFIIAFVTESSIVIIQSITRKNKTQMAVARIKTIPLQDEDDRSSFISKETFLRVQRFKNYIDSLSTTTNGKKFRDSLLKNRPHLMDSVNFLLNLFLEQSNVKQNEK